MGSKDPRRFCDKSCPRFEEDIENPRLRGEGPLDAKIMLIGEAPGQHEDRKGKPFIGRSGQLLNTVLAECGTERDSLYITNAVKCATAGGDAAPKQREITCCRQYIVKEIERIKPNVIGVLGNTPLQAVLKRQGITKLKNNVYFSDEFGVKVVPVFHPAHVLRNPGNIEEFRKGIELVLNEGSGREKLYESKIKAKHRDASTSEDLDKLFLTLEAQDHFVMDLETSSLNFLDAKILCVALSWRDGIGVTVSWDALQGQNEYMDRFRKLLTSGKLIINHNLKFDLLMLKHHKIEVKGPFFDTLLAAALINENMPEKDLGACTLQYLDIGEYWSPLDKWREEYCKEHKLKKEKFSYSLFPYPLLSDYAQWDADATHRLYTIFKKLLDKDDLREFMDTYSVATMQLLIDMEYAGVKVDREQLYGLVKAYNEKLKKIADDVFAIKEVQLYQKIRKKRAVKKLVAKYEKSKNIRNRFPTPDQYAQKMIKEKDWRFNQNSVPQLQEVLFKVYNETPIKFSEKTKKPSTDEEVLTALASNGNRLAITILKHRKLAKYISTYLYATYEKSELDGRIHANYLQHKARTGRLSCVAPNMQNIPREAKDFKKCFLADPGYIFVKGDLKQAEFRCWAHYSGDPDMLRDIASGLDIHRRTASEVFNVPMEEVTEEQRTAAKGAVFGLMYGRGAAAVAEAFGITLEQAQNLKKNFFARYPLAEQWLQEQINFAEENGYVKTWMGRIRRLPDIYSENQGVKAKAQRDAMNSPIQGLASNMNDCFMYESYKLAKEYNIDCYPAVTQHDAQIFQVKKKQLRDLILVMHRVIEKTFPDFKCKMALDFEAGETLGTLEKVKT